MTAMHSNARSGSRGMSEWGLPNAILRFYLELWFVSPGSRSSRSRLPRKVSAERVGPVSLNGILADACAARNGWKVILGRCAPEKSKTVLAAAS
jgi:hypothetical protein